MAALSRPLTAEEERLMALMRTKGLSVRGLDEETRAALKGFVSALHVEGGMSLTDLAKLIGNKTSGYTSWLCRELGVKARPFEEARLKGIREKRRKYERRPFDGTDEDRAYLLGLRHGDLSVSEPWKGAVRVSTSTTHPAMAELFTRLFEGYGHVYHYPRYKKDTHTYEWNLSTHLDESYRFLLNEMADSLRWVEAARRRTRGYLAGLLDAEGSIGLYPAKRQTALMVVFYNTNLMLLERVHGMLVAMKHSPLRPYLDKPKGFRSPGYRIEMKKDYWRLVVAGFDDAQSLVSELPLRHAEKVAKKKLAISLVHREPWAQVERRVVALRAQIKSERDAFVVRAHSAVDARDFLKRKPPGDAEPNSKRS